MPELAALEAAEILDSRGRPTLEVRATLTDGTSAVAGVPSGASTGRQEAVEARDGDPQRYAGRGVLTAARTVRTEINEHLEGMPMRDLQDVLDADQELRAADATTNFHRLGANAAVGVSMALARAVARSRQVALWALFADHTGYQPRLPVPHFNVINGGAHAPNDLAFQEFMVAPLGAQSMAEALRTGAEVYQSLRRTLRTRGLAAGVGDEGGFAAMIDDPEEALRLLVEAITEAGYAVGPGGVAIALDPAANSFRVEDGYVIRGRTLSSAEMVDWYCDLVARFPIWSIEDGLAEDDEDGWRHLTRALGERVQLVGDDIFVTDEQRVRHAARERVANACLVKPNQIGTVRLTLETITGCREVGYAQMVSHRSGETNDSFIADLAVGIGCGQLKSGAPARGERLAKYNRLVAIERSSPMPYGMPDRAR